MKGITPVVAIVVLLLMTVAACMGRGTHFPSPPLPGDPGVLDTRGCSPPLTPLEVYE